MPLITLSPLLLLITDSLAWLLFHLGISFGLRKVSDAFFERHANWFRSFAFEKGGRIWSEVFRIRQWKDKLPDGTVIAKKALTNPAWLNSKRTIWKNSSSRHAEQS